MKRPVIVNRENRDAWKVGVDPHCIRSPYGAETVSLQRLNTVMCLRLVVFDTVLQAANTIANAMSPHSMEA